jgi:hypothetical protein
MSIKDLLKKFLAPPAASTTHKYRLDPVFVHGEQFIMATGTSQKQSALTQLGTGPHSFLLIPELDNKHDAKAVKVEGVHRGTGIEVGLLPSGTPAQESIHTLGNLMFPQGKVIMVEGDVMSGEAGLSVRLFLPTPAKVKGLEASYKP